MRQLLYLAGLIILTSTIFSCTKEPINYRVKNKNDIREYIMNNNLPADSTSSGLFYVIEKMGGSEHPNINSKVIVHYKGKLLDGSVFDKSSPDSPLDIELADLIVGWQEGIPLIGRGGKIKLIIPAHLGYGSRAIPGIPANSVLIFDIDLIDFS